MEFADRDRNRFRRCFAQGESCWPWQQYITPKGYGKFTLAGCQTGAHRAAYLLFVGPLAPGMQVDHVCHNSDKSCPGGDSCQHRRCVNPAHLEAVTGQVNTARGRTIAAANAAKEHCDSGHEFTPGNTYIMPDGCRACRRCRDDAAARDRTRKKARQAPDEREEAA